MIKICEVCNVEKEHYAKGKCKSCYSKEFWSKNYTDNERIKKMAREKSRKSWLKNKDRLLKLRREKRIENGDSVREYFREAQKRYRKRLSDIGSSDRDVYLYGGTKRLVYERDNYSCVDCGISQSEYLKLGCGMLHVHHIDGSGWGKTIKEKNNNIDNLVTLCNKCHSRETQRILHKHRPRTLEEFKN
jgi:hypothetical protein